jgi:hypothetical protein
MPDSVSSTLMQGLDAGLSIQDVLLSQIDTNDPMMAMVARMITERAASPAEHVDTEFAPDSDDDEKQRLKRLIGGVRQLRRESESLRTEIEELQLRNDTLAGALGACYLCWGEYPLCEICNGKGSPGHFPISMQTFNEYILPAIRSVKSQKTPATPLRQVEYESIQ